MVNQALPSEYFPDQYLNDLSVFTDMDITQTTHIEMPLCGLTLGNLIEPSKANLYFDRASFICTSYELNLLNQGIYTYFHALHGACMASMVPFLDMRNCGHGHGGLYNPDSIIRFARSQSYCYEEQTDIDELFARYTMYFFFGYLEEIIHSLHSERLIALNFNPSRLLDLLVKDPDCPELQGIVRQLKI